MWQLHVGQAAGLQPTSSLRLLTASLPPASTTTPAAGKGAQGKLGSSGGTLLTQYLLKNKGGLQAPKDEDVRAAILRHAGEPPGR